MKFTPTKLPEVVIIEPDLKEDSRGYFLNAFLESDYRKAGIDFSVDQISRSYNLQKGIIRGMHFQKEPHAQAKIVQCLSGAIFDVVIDVRGGSSTYGEWIGVMLDSENKKLLYIPKGFAHGFQVVSVNAEVEYFISGEYLPEHASGVRFDDPHFNIQWPIAGPILSEQDQSWPLFSK